MSDRRLSSSSDRATRGLGRVLGALVEAGDVILLSGDLGAGKTQLTKGIAEGMGVSASVPSPTFNILLVHQGRIPLYHFDLYRLEHEDQLEDIDYFATLEADGVAVVEWGDRFPGARPSDGVNVVIHVEDSGMRTLSLEALGERGGRLIETWCAAAEEGGSS